MMKMHQADVPLQDWAPEAKTIKQKGQAILAKRLLLDKHSENLQKSANEYNQFKQYSDNSQIMQWCQPETSFKRV